jgi:alpha-D-xyloside xylohydrolase
MAVLHNPLLEDVRFPSVVPPLPRTSGGPDPVVRASVEHAADGALELNGLTSHGVEVRVALAAVAPGVTRVQLRPAIPTGGYVRLAHLPHAPVAARVERATADCVRLSADGAVVEVDLDPFRLKFLDAAGRVLLQQDPLPKDVTGRLSAPPFGITRHDGRVVATHDTFVCEPDEHFFGFGEKFTNFDKRGQWLEMWNYDAHGVNSERAYKNVPFFVSSRGYGMFVDSVAPLRFDMAATNHSTFSVIAPEDSLEYYLIVGAEPLEIIRRYSDLVGRPMLPPKWAFGLWVSSGFKADSGEATVARARELREYEIPSDVLHLDCYWQKWGCWSDLEWDADVFREPERMLRDIKSMGFRTCLWINPYIGIESDRFAMAAERGWLLRTPGGEPYVLQLWGGYHPPVGILDLTQPDAATWFVGRLRELLRMGADVFKTDFGEGVPSDAVAYAGTTGSQLHNQFTLVYNDLVADVTAAETGGPGLVWGRSTYAGGQRHAAQWGGDPNCSYADLASTLRGGLSLSACGHAFWSHDIGGFNGQPEPDLYVRWAQFGMFSPMARLHGTTTRLPWDYGDEVLCRFRELARLRYRLLPYVYSCAVHAATTGEPIMRALPLVYPADPMFAACELEYLFGPDLLVAPIYNAEGKRPVVFPPGTWIDFWSHEVITGPVTRHVECGLDQFPLYVRANALIPTAEPQLSLRTDEPWHFVVFDGYVLDTGHAILRDTDGTTEIAISITDSAMDVLLTGAKNVVGLRISPLRSNGLDTVTVNGAVLQRRGAVALDASSASGWTVDPDGGLVALVQRH